MMKMITRKCLMAWLLSRRAPPQTRTSIEITVPQSRKITKWLTVLLHRRPKKKLVNKLRLSILQCPRSISQRIWRRMPHLHCLWLGKRSMKYRRRIKTCIPRLTLRSLYSSSMKAAYSVAWLVSRIPRRSRIEPWLDYSSVEVSQRPITLQMEVMPAHICWLVALA